MKKAALRFLVIIVSTFVASVALLYLTRSRPVIFSFAPDPAMLRPRNYCLLNPFRDKTPEMVAETYLRKMREGKPEAIRPFLKYDQDYCEHIVKSERKWPVRSWRIGERIDKAGETELMYWVTRGGGYSRDGHEEEAHFRVRKSAGSWALDSYSAIY